jgi:hypothetical protein
MQPITSFRASALPPAELNALVADYLALERARLLRRLYVTRFGALTAVMALVSLWWLPHVAFWFNVTLCLVPPAWTWRVERQCARSLARRLDSVPEIRKS